MPHSFAHSRPAVLAIALLILATSAARLRADPPAARLTLAAYNVEDFVDVFDDPYTKDETLPVKPRAAIEQIARAIREVNPDVMAFEEIENEGTLRAMVSEFLPGMGYEYILVNPTNSEFGINLGLISRKPVVSVTSHRWQDLHVEGVSRPRRFARDLLRVRIQATPQQVMDVFIAHLHSRHDSGADEHVEHWRLAEATAARRIIGEVLTAEPDAWVAMVGDFNDTPETATLARLTRPFNNAPALLADMHAALSPDHRITYIKAPYRSTIDYILASPALARHMIPGSAHVLEDTHVLSGSDHAPVYVAFDLGPDRAGTKRTKTAAGDTGR